MKLYLYLKTKSIYLHVLQSLSDTENVRRNSIFRKFKRALCIRKSVIDDTELSERWTFHMIKSKYLWIWDISSVKINLEHPVNQKKTHDLHPLLLLKCLPSIFYTIKIYDKTFITKNKMRKYHSIEYICIV